MLLMVGKVSSPLLPFITLNFFKVLFDRNRQITENAVCLDHVLQSETVELEGFDLTSCRLNVDASY